MQKILRLSHLILSTLIFLLINNSAFCQAFNRSFDKNETPNFYKIQNDAENYFKGKEDVKGKGYKPYKRWEYFWQSRVDKDGNFPEAGITEKNWNKYLKKLNISSDKRNNSSNCSGNWTSYGPNSSTGGYAGIGRINCIAFHPTNSDIIWAGTPAGGLWKSTNGGDTWFPKTDDLPNLGVSDIVIHPTNPEIMYIATGDEDGITSGSGYGVGSVGVLKSIDGGNSWNTTGLTFNVAHFNVISSLVIDKNNSNILLASTDRGIYKSFNSGVEWSKQLSGDFTDLVANPNAGSNTYYSVEKNYESENRVCKIYKSTNDGDSWILVKTIIGSERAKLAVSPANSSFVYALLTNSSYGYLGLYRSVDAGENFSLRSSSPNILGYNLSGNDSGGQGWYDLCIAVDPVNAEIVYTGGINIWKSVNGGTTWTIKTYWGTNVHADHHCLAWQNNSVLWNGNDGGIYRTSNGGTNWYFKSNGLAISQIYKIGVSQLDSKVINGLQDNGTKLHYWTPLTIPGNFQENIWTDEFGGDGMDCAIRPDNSNIMYCSHQHGEILRSTNGGNGWGYISDNIPDGGTEHRWLAPFSIDPNVHTTIYTAYQDLYKSINQGNSWTKIGTLGGEYKDYIHVAPSNSNYIYVGSSSNYFYGSSSNYFYKTTNGGVSWNNLGFPSRWAKMLAIHPLNPNTLWAVFSNYSDGEKVYKSIDGGVTWINISGSLPNLPVNCIVYQNGTANGIYIGMDVGVYYLDDNLSDWELFNGGLPNTTITELEIRYSDNSIYAATYGRGLWSADLRSNQLAGTYTVGVGQDFPTLTAAISSYNTSCLAGDVVFELTDAVYSTNEIFPLSIFKNPTSDYNKTLTIKPVGGVQSIISGAPESGVLYIYGAEFINIDGVNSGGTSLVIRNNNTNNPSAAIHISSAELGKGAKDISIKNCVLETGSNTNQNSFGIFIGGSPLSVSNLGIDNYNIQIENNVIRKSYYGIFNNSISTDPLDFLVIYGNTIGADEPSSYVTYRGIDLSYVNYAYISNNVIKNMKINFDATNIAMNFNSGINYGYITNNKISGIWSENLTGKGAYGINFSSSLNVSNNTLANNFISDIKTINYGDGQTNSNLNNAFGIRLSGGIGTKIYYNSVNLFGNITSLSQGNNTVPLSSALVVTNNSVTGLDVRNNIFNNRQTFNSGVPKIYSVWVPSGFLFSNFNNNDYYGTNGTSGNLTTYKVGRIGSNDYTSLANWRTGSGQDANSVNVLPVFVSNTDLHLVAASSGGLNANAVSLFDIGVDIDGDFRNGTSPDIGADEVGPSEIVDAGITNILFNGSTCVGSNNTYATVKNYGTVTLTSVIIQWSLAPGGTLNQFNTGPINIPPGQSQDFIIGYVNLNSNTTYSITANTYLPNGITDVIQANNGFTKSNITTGLMGTYTVGIGGNYPTITSAIADYNSKSLCGHVIFELINPIYNTSNGESFPIVINQNNTANSLKTLTIRPKPGVSVTISGSTSSGQAVLKLFGADFINIDGVNSSGSLLTIENTSIAENTGCIWLASLGTGAGSKRNTIKNCNIKAGSNTVTSTFGIHIGGLEITIWSFYGTPGEDNDSLLVLNNRIYKASYGIYARATSTSPNNNLIIKNNIFGSNISSDYIKIRGIDIWGATDPIIDGNYIFNIKSIGAAVSAIEFGPWIYNASIINNKIEGIYNENLDGMAAYGINFSWNQYCNNNLIANNFITDIRTINIDFQLYAVGIEIKGGTNFKIYNNTVYLFGNITIVSGTSNNPGSCAFEVRSNTVTGLELRNNIFINKQRFSTGAPKIYSVVLPANFVFSVFNNNNYFGTNGTSGNTTAYHVGRIGTTSYTSLSSWKTITGQESNSVNINPVFVSDLDLHLIPLSNISLGNLGTPLSQISLDIDGDIRNSLIPDMGADEFNSQLCSNASSGILNTTPSNIICANQQITIQSSGFSTGIGSLYQWQTAPTGTENWTIVQSTSVYSPLILPSLTVSTDVKFVVYCDGDISNSIITITVNPKPSSDFTINSNTCFGSDIQLQGLSDIGTIFNWSGPNSFNSNLQNPTVINANFSSTGFYNFTTYTAAGCSSAVLAKEVIIKNKPSEMIVNPSEHTICPGANAVLLSASASISSSGKIGSGNLQLGQTTPYDMATGGNKTQYLFLANELAQLGMNAGDKITKLSMRVGFISRNYTFNNFIIKMKNTTSTVLTNVMQTGTTNVYGPINFQVSGTAPFDIKHTLTTGFIWDGTSNLLIEYCFNNNDGGGIDFYAAAYVESHSTPAAYTSYFSSNYNQNVCSNPLSNQTYTTNNRPNIIFDFIKYPQITWAPNGVQSGLYTNASLSTVYNGETQNSVYARPGITTTYTPTATFGSRFTFDGKFNENDWGTPLSTSNGGPPPGFGPNHRINALYVRSDQFNNDLNIALAGNVESFVKILLFIDSKSGGFNNGGFGRNLAPTGINNFNSNTSFDPGFTPDYCLIIGKNESNNVYNVNLYTLSGTFNGTYNAGGGPNTFLGDNLVQLNGSKIGASPDLSSLFQGFEIAIPKHLINYQNGSLKLMAMYISDQGYLSNQFLSPAASNEGDYGTGPINFANVLPNPINVPESNLTNYCYTSKPVIFGVEGTIVKNPNNIGLHSLRSILGCIAENDTITYDQLGIPSYVSSSFLEGSLEIDKNVTIKGLNHTNKPIILFNGNLVEQGFIIRPTKTLTLDNVDILLFNPTNMATFVGPGNVKISNSTKITKE